MGTNGWILRNSPPTDIANLSLRQLSLVLPTRPLATPPYLWLQPPAGLTEALSMSGSPPFDPPSPVLMDISPDTRFPVPVPPADEPVVVSSSTEPTSTSAPPMEDRELSLPTAEVTSPLLESPVARAASPVTTRDFRSDSPIFFRRRFYSNSTL